MPRPTRFEELPEGITLTMRAKRPILPRNGPRHWYSPSTHAIWYLAEIGRENRAFPDWGCLWASERKKRQDQALQTAKWRQKTREERDRINARIRSYRATDEAKAKRRAYKAKRKILDPAGRIKDALRTRLYKFVRGKYSSGIKHLLGCSWGQLRAHLEAKFRDGMTWENYGTFWHIDHIVPCAAYDHKKPQQVRQCWHFSNLRPLLAIENLKKGSKIEAPQLPLPLCA